MNLGAATFLSPLQRSIREKGRPQIIQIDANGGGEEAGRAHPGRTAASPSALGSEPVPICCIARIGTVEEPVEGGDGRGVEVERRRYGWRERSSGKNRQVFRANTPVKCHDRTPTRVEVPSKFSEWTSTTVWMRSEFSEWTSTRVEIPSQFSEWTSTTVGVRSEFAEWTSTTVWICSEFVEWTPSRVEMPSEFVEWTSTTDEMLAARKGWRGSSVGGFSGPGDGLSSRTNRAEPFSPS